jgi:MFS family permease
MKTPASNKDLYLYFAAEFARGVYFAYAIATLFYLSIGINYTQLGTLWLAMAVCQAVLEIPFGVLSDRIGHKATIILGYLALGGAMALIGSGTDFWLPFAGGALWGVSNALLSGASDAYLYDTLKTLGREDAYLKLKGYHTMLLSLGIVVGAIPGAYLYRIDGRYPWYAQAACILVAVLVFLFAKDLAPARDDGDRAKGWDHFRTSLSYVLGHRELLWLTLFFTLTTFPLYGLAVVRQPYLLERQFAVVHLGYLLAGTEVLGSVIGFLAHRIEKALGSTRSLLMIVILLLVLLLLLAIVRNRWAIAPLMLLYASFRFQKIILNAYTNRRIPSAQRATILSIQSMGEAILLIAFMLSSGIILDLFSIDRYLITLAGYVAFVVVPLWLLRRRFNMT